MRDCFSLKVVGIDTGSNLFKGPEVGQAHWESERKVMGLKGGIQWRKGKMAGKEV